MADSDGGSSGDESLSRRSPGPGAAAGLADCLHAVLPQRGRIVREGRTGHHPATPVSEGGTGEVHASGEFLRRTRETHARCRGGFAETRPALPRGYSLHRGHGAVLGEDVRHRSLAAGTATVPRNFVLLELRIVSGAARQHSL